MNIREVSKKSINGAKYLTEWAIHSTRKYLKPYYVLFQQWSNDGVLAVNIRSEIGLFAQLNWCLYIFAHCERYRLRPYIILSGTNYQDESKGGNWFDYFFENRQLTDGDRKNIHDNKIRVSTINTVNELRLDRNYDSYLTLERAFFLVNKYLGIRKPIKDYVCGFEERLFAKRSVLGVHYRGTDKGAEAPRVPWETCRDAIYDYLAKRSEIEAVFVSSDEEPFVHYILKEIRRVPVLYHEDQFRSLDCRKVHVASTKLNNYKKGEEALINSLLLSKCSAVIRTVSFLSAWSSVFNPNLEVILLNRPHDGLLWFPECAIVKRCAA